MADEYDQEIGPELAMHLAIEREVGIGVVSKNYSDADMRERSLRIDGENKVRIEAHLSPGNPVPQAGIEFPAVYGERLYTFVYKSFSSTRGTIARGFHLFTRQNAVMTNSMVILKLVDGGRSARVFVIPPEYLGSNLVKDVSDIPIYRLDYIPENIRMVSIGFLTSYKHTDSVAKIYQDQKTFNGFRGIHEVGFTPDVGFSKATLKNNSVFLVGYLSHLSMEDINML